MKEKFEDRNFIYTTPQKKNWKYFLKIFLFPILSFFYKMTMKIHHRRGTNKKKYNVALCAIFKNESAYLKEWITFHQIVGVSHFYMYNNNSNDNYYEILKPYIESGLVEVINWEKDHAQMDAYRDCISRFSHDSQWIGFIDIDEFVIPNKYDTIGDFLRPFENKRPAVMMYWRIFGTSGRVERNIQNLVTEDFTVCWSKYINIGKCFYNTSYRFDFKTEKNSSLHHCLWCKIGFITVPPVNILDKISFSTRHKIHKGALPIQINHYFTKSYKEYLAKSARGDVYYKLSPYDEAYFYKYESKCDDIDYSAYKYLIKLKTMKDSNG